MEFFDLVYKRQTIRKYKEDEPPRGDIEKIIDAARVAPSATNSQNWRFIAIFSDAVKEKMKSAVDEKYDELAQMVEDKEFQDKIIFYRAYASFFRDAPVVIACVECAKEGFLGQLKEKTTLSDAEIARMRPDSSLLSMGAAIENMALAACNLGYGSCWMCAPIVAYENLEKVLGLGQDEKIVSLLTIGVPFYEENKRAPKKEFEEIAEFII